MTNFKFSLLLSTIAFYVTSTTVLLNQPTKIVMFTGQLERINVSGSTKWLMEKKKGELNPISAKN